MKGLDLISYKEPTSPIAEAYRTLRTNIQFSSFDEKVKTILVTSSGPGEGKTTTASNLAVVMAQSGNKTILIDCDLRKPRVHKAFGISNQVGLSDLLADQMDQEGAIKLTEIPNLHVLSSGTRPPNPAELLGSGKMKKFVEALKENYDVIVLDTPPIILVTDAQIIAQYADGCLLVISSGQAERESAIKAKQLLEKVNGKILGVVFNKVDVTRKSYYHYSYEYGEKKSTNNNTGKRRRR